jgi:hypothetical protein
MRRTSPKKQNSVRTPSQITAGTDVAISPHVGFLRCLDSTILLLDAQAESIATVIATPAAVKFNQSYSPGTKKRALLATNRANRLSMNNDNAHFIVSLYPALKNERIIAVFAFGLGLVGVKSASRKQPR